MENKNNPTIWLVLLAVLMAVAAFIWLYPSKETPQAPESVVAPVNEQTKPVYKEYNGKG